MTGMPRTSFGSSDLQVTRLCQGTAFRTLARDASDERAEAVLRHCLARGVRFFDSSNAYGWGGSERLLGAALRGRRDDVIICTKVSPHAPPHEDGTPGAARPFTEAHLQEQLDGSRQRLETDVIDLYLLHSPDGVTPLAELCVRMQGLIDSGRIRHWGVSNYSAEQVQGLLATARSQGTTLPVGVEDYYTIAGGALTTAGCSRPRLLEREMFPLLRQENLGLLAFSPMDGGALAPGQQVPTDSCLIPLLNGLDGVAAELSVSRAAVCVAWMLHQEAVTSVLAGAESPEHVDEMIEGTTLELPADLLERLTQASLAYATDLEAA